MTTEGQGENATNATATLITVGVVLVGATSAGVTLAATLPHAMAHLEARRRAIRADLARGRGPFVAELAARLGLDAEDAAHLAEHLKRQRDRLDLHLRSAAPLDVGATRAFLLDLIGVIRQEPRFRSSVERLVALADAVAADR